MWAHESRGRGIARISTNCIAITGSACGCRSIGNGGTSGTPFGIKWRDNQAGSIWRRIAHEWRASAGATAP